MTRRNPFDDKEKPTLSEEKNMIGRNPIEDE